ncbi:hypothetical protein PMI16_03822 [Herbaspirillum sp. CF444]|uniref:hypothetical protein n=1 Tax=Herbaspirillum sp. CF444 TaxID=1144319 RepID=UPI0002725DFF|nr:hypothetical protein [Herbaspirillum sp. CF444]EJL84346.1 hypothetical protein PMI16_03822 [Herbaspirillum sp. CF444]
MNTQQIISLASNYLNGLRGHEFDVLEVSKPVSPDAAVNLAKIVSKLSPLVGNLIEFNSCEYLNDQDGFEELGHWVRQDPGFPDTIFAGNVFPTPGFEIKAWFPLATEITARFKDSQDHFASDQTYVAMLAWLPENLIFGKPKIIDIMVASGASISMARDNHYHSPPDYLVLEPGDTSDRTSNLQQTNTNGYKFQGTSAEFAQAQQLVDSWGEDGRRYSTSAEYHRLLRTLIERFPYRLDTNFAKMDRIAHPDIERFKSRVYGTTFHGKTIGEWNRLLSKGDNWAIKVALEQELGIIEEGRTPVE